MAENLRGDILKLLFQGRTNKNNRERKDFYWEWRRSLFFNFGGDHDCVRITY